MVPCDTFDTSSDSFLIIFKYSFWSCSSLLCFAIWMILNEQSWLFWIYLDIGVCSQPVYSGTNPQIKTWHLLPFGLGASYPKLLWKLECVGPPNENLHEICILDKWKRRSHNIGALWTPPVRLRARKISAVYYDLTYPKATMLPQLLVSLPLRLSLKFSHWIKSPPPSTHESWMKIFKLSPSLKGLAEEIMPTGGGGELLPLPFER